MRSVCRVPVPRAPTTMSSASSSQQHQTVPLLIIPTPGGGTRLQPLMPSNAAARLLCTPASTSVSAVPKSDSAAAASSDGDAATPPAVTLDYVINESDGSCMCKLCGEVLSSRTHWYRHKYKVITRFHSFLMHIYQVTKYLMQ